MGVRKKVLFAVITLFFSLGSFAQSKVEIVCGPYLQNVTVDGATIVWVTNVDAVSWVEIAPDDGTHFYNKSREKYFDSPIGGKKVGRIHQVEVTGLSEATSYHYRVYSQEVVENRYNHMRYGKTVVNNVYKNNPYSFKTADLSGEGVRFVMVNDIHGDSARLSRLLAQVEVAKSDFVLFNGDMISQMESEQKLFDGFVNTAVEVFAKQRAFVMARGNHETRGVLAGQYLDYFPSPTNRPYYSFRRGGAYFIVIDGGEDKPDNDIEYQGLSDYDRYRERQAKWLERELESEEFRSAIFKIIIVHIPPIKSTWHGTVEVERLFASQLNGRGIDLMLSGHLHKHHYVEAGSAGYDFPILINSNMHVVEVDFFGNKKEVTIKDGSGEVVKNISLAEK